MESSKCSKSELTYQHIIDILVQKKLKNSKNSFEKVYKILLESKTITSEDEQLFSSKFSILVAKLSNQHYSRAEFCRRNSDYVSSVVFPSSVVQKTPERKKDQPKADGRKSTDSIKILKPKKGDFDKLSTPAKHNRMDEVIEKFNLSELSFAFSQKLKVEHPKLANYIKKLMKDKENFVPPTVPQVEKLPCTAAVGKVMKANLSWNQYAEVAKRMKVFPNIRKVRKYCNEIYPNSVAISTTEREVKITLSELFTNTVRGLMEILGIKNDEDARYKVIFKWGFDSCRIKEYRLKTVGDYEKQTHCMITVIVPLMVKKISEESDEIIWRNPAPNSPNFCRPISHIYAKETPQLSREIYDDFNLQAEFLGTLRIHKSLFDHQFILSMLDGKCLSAIGNITNTRECQICTRKHPHLDKPGEKFRDMEDRVASCLPALHMKLRMLEFILQIGFKMERRNYNALKTSYKARKVEKELELQKKLKIFVNIVNPYGGGNSNTGNTARKFFRHHEEVANILGFDPRLMKDIYILILAYEHSDIIIREKVEILCGSIETRFKQLYPWVHWNPTFHKMIFHPNVLLTDTPIALGELAEEALEANHKFVKNSLETKSRKTSRLDTVGDTFRRALLRSYPTVANEITERKIRKVPEILREYIGTTFELDYDDFWEIMFVEDVDDEETESVDNEYTLHYDNVTEAEEEEFAKKTA